MFCLGLARMRLFLILTAVLLRLPPAFAVKGGHLLNENDPAFHSIVQLIAISQTNGDIYACSGTFIAQNLVATAAHCFTDDKTGRKLKHFKFYVHRGNLEGEWLK